MKSFSQRKGLAPVSSTIQIECMSDELRNSLWNVIYRQLKDPVFDFDHFSQSLWDGYFKEAIDTRPINKINSKNYNNAQILLHIRQYFQSAHWNEVYDFLEFYIHYFQSYLHLGEQITFAMNETLSREFSGYKVIDGVFVDITNDQEVQLLDTALKDCRFESVTTHLARALQLLADREKPDYRNSIKESISAVEAMSRIVAGNNSATLGEALRALERNNTLHPALKKGFSNLYGYTSGSGGIRHAILEGDREPDQSDAKYFLLSCTSFTNYLKSKV